jgi:hypothetical protein
MSVIIVQDSTHLRSRIWSEFTSLANPVPAMYVKIHANAPAGSSAQTGN